MPHNQGMPVHPWRGQPGPAVVRQPRVDPWVATSAAPYRPAPPRPPTGWPSPPRRRNVSTWAVIGGCVIAVAAVIAGGVIAISSTGSHSSTRTASSAPTSTAATTTATSIAPANVGVEQLPGLLLDASTVNAILGATGMTVDAEMNPASPFAGDDIDRPECGGISSPIQKPVYDGSGWIAMQKQYLREPTEQWRHSAEQAVVNFPTAAQASKFAAREADRWAKCQDITFRARALNPPTEWAVDAVNNRDGMLTALLIAEGADGWRCQHALSARNNVVIDVLACGFQVSDQAAAIATTIADRVATRS